MEPPSEQWKSALCVTSLYDSYIQLQQENEELKKQLQMIPPSKKQAQQPESSDVEEQLRHEIRLLRAEKTQMIDLHTQRTQQLEKQMTEFKTMHAQQVQKYQQKFALDPQVSSRVALAGQTLRDTLERVVHEKDELLLRYDALHQLYQQTKDDQQKVMQDLQSQVQRLQQNQHQQAKQRIGMALERWALTRLRQAWAKLEMNVMQHRLHQSGRESVEAIQQQNASRFERLRTNQVALIMGRKTQTILWRVFQQWHHNSRHRTAIRDKVLCMLRNRIHSNTRSTFFQWRQVTRKQARYVIASERIDKLIHSHRRRRAWEKWYHVTYTCHFIEAAQEVSKQLKARLVEAQMTIETLEQNMASLEVEYLEVKNQLFAERNQHTMHLELNHTTQLDLQQRLGAFFRNRTNAQLRGKIFISWKHVSHELRTEKKRIHNFRACRFRMVLQRKILAWHVQTKFQQRYRLVTINYLMRMRQIGVMRCFNAWKQDVNGRKERDMIKWRVICHMKHRQIRRTFNQWLVFKSQRQNNRNLIVNMLRFLEKMHISVNFARWRTHTTSIEVALRLTQEQKLEQQWHDRLVETKQTMNCLRQAFTGWHNTVIYAKTFRNMSTSVVKRWKSGILARCLREWQYFVSSRKQQRTLVKRWVGQYSMSAMQRAWSRWQTHTTLKTQHEMFVAWTQENMACKLRLETALTECKHREHEILEKYHESEEQRVREIEKLNDRVQYLTKQRRRFEQVAVVLCSSKEHHQTLRRSFKAWKIKSDQRRIQRSHLRRHQEKYQKKKILEILGAWRRILIRRTRFIMVMRLLQSCSCNHHAIQCFTSWKAFMANQKAVRVFSQAFGIKSEQQRLTFVFQSWRQDSRKRALLRKMIQRIWFHSIQEKLKSHFQKWVLTSKSLRSIEQKETRAQSLLALQVKICAKWTSCGLQTVFSGWRRATDGIKRQKEFVCKFKSRRAVLLMTRSFTSWREIIRLSNSRRAFLVHRFADLEDVCMKEAFQRWKIALLHWREHEIATLKCLNSVQELSLAEKDRALQTAIHDSTTTMQELLQWKLRFDETSANSQSLIQRMILRQSYDAWKASTCKKRSVKMQYRFFQTRQALLLSRYIFNEWKMVRHRRIAVLTTVNDRHRRVMNVLVRNCIREWNNHARLQKCMQIRLKGFARRLKLRSYRSHFDTWYSVVHRWMVLKDILPKLDVIMSQAEVRSAFTLWKDDTSDKRIRDALQRAKQKRLLEFILTKDAGCLERIMQSWKQLVASKKAKHASAARSYSNACVRTNRVTWKLWIQSVQHTKNQRKAIIALEDTVRVYHLRTALSTWKNQIHRDEVKRLRELSDRLSEQLATTADQLGFKANKVGQLNEDIADLKGQLTDAKSSLTQISATMEYFTANVKQERTRANALNRVLLLSLTHTGVFTAFGRWKMKYLSDRMKLAACKRLGRIFTSREKLFSFWTWKIYNVRINRLKALEHVLAQRLVQRTLQGWKAFISRRSKIKQFLLILAAQLAPRETSSVRFAFILWRRGSQVISMENQAAQFTTSLQREKLEANALVKKIALARVCWQAYHHRLRQMQGFISHARTVSFQNTIKELKHQIQAMKEAREQMSLEYQTNLKLASRAGENQVEKGATIKSIEEKYIAGSLFQALQTLFRRVTQATTMTELFTGISSASAQSLHGISAVLFLFDPCTNELWTQREDSKIIQVPGSLGIAGYTLSTASSLLVIDAPADQRFHPMVDQFVLAGLRHGDRSLGASYTSYGLTRRKNDTSISIFSACLLSTDGAAYGVLQIAFHNPLGFSPESTISTTEVQLFGRISCLFVEQLLYDMVRNCRDQVRARSPEKFSTLFKQNKSWRKYYMAMEAKVKKTEAMLRSVTEHKQALIEENSSTLETAQQLQDAQETYALKEHELKKELLAWKKKILKMKALVDAKEQVIQEKSEELERTTEKLTHFRRQQRTKDWQEMMQRGFEKSPDGPSMRRPAKRAQEEEADECADENDKSGENQHILRADCATLKNKLLRAESDNHLLVKAIDMARRHDGVLPKTISVEVDRISLRVQQAAITS